MGEAADEDSLSLLSMKDFQDRGIEIDNSRTGLQILTVVARLASEKLNEKKISTQVVNNPVDRILKQRSVSEKEGSSSRLRSGDDLYSKKGLGFMLVDGVKTSNGDNKECVTECRKEEKKKKKKKSKQSEENDSDSHKKRRRRTQIVLNVIHEDLPRQFMERIEQLKGSKIGLVIEKHLFPSDVSDNQYRLSVPPNQIILSAADFLSDDENRCIDSGGRIQVKHFIDPQLHHYDNQLVFKRQTKPPGESDRNNNNDNKKKKKKAKNSICYVLMQRWREILRRNNLQCDDKIQLWKFRAPADELCFALVLVAKFFEHNNNNYNDGNREDGTSMAAVNK